MSVGVFDNYHRRSLIHDAAKKGRETFAVDLRGEQEAPLILVHGGQLRVDKENLGDVNEAGIVGHVVDVLAHWQQRVLEYERLHLATSLAGAAALIVLVAILVLAGAFHRSVVEQVEENVLEHSQEDWILLQPTFGVGSRDLLRSLSHNIVSETFGEFLHAIFDDAEAARLP